LLQLVRGSVRQYGLEFAQSVVHEDCTGDCEPESDPGELTDYLLGRNKSDFVSSHKKNGYASSVLTADSQ
jgi:hypothetical protein